MSEPDDIRAAEYVLGTMPASERLEFETELSGNPALRLRVQYWEVKLSPLAASVPDIEPPSDMLARVERAIDLGRQGDVLNLQQLQRSRNLWRSIAVAATALAAALAFFAFLPATFFGDRSDYIAIVDRGGDLPALIVHVDLKKQVLAVQAVAAQTPDDRSLELWLIAGASPPTSAGLLEGTGSTKVLPSGFDRSNIINATFAVSVEPRGGSPTGKPTGPVIYSGKLIRETR